MITLMMTMKMSNVMFVWTEKSTMMMTNLLYVMAAIQPHIKVAMVMIGSCTMIYQIPMSHGYVKDVHLYMKKVKKLKNKKILQFSQNVSFALIPRVCLFTLTSKRKIRFIKLVGPTWHALIISKVSVFLIPKGQS